MLPADFIDPRLLAFAIVLAMMGLFAWGRWRYDFVAMMSLLTAVAAGIVPPNKAFSGFSDDIVIIVGSALVVSAAIGRSGVVERFARAVGPYLTNTPRQVLALAGSVGIFSGLVKNIGALAMLMPVAFQIARRNNTAPSSLLMPMAFASLLGGTVTLVGTSPNIIVSRIREQMLGAPFTMFDFAPVGGVLLAVGLVFLAFGWRLLPVRKGAVSMDAAFNLEAYTTEVTVPETSPCVDITIASFEKASNNEVEVITLLRGRRRRYQPAGNMVIKAGDILILQGEPGALEQLVALEKLDLIGERTKAAAAKAEAKEARAEAKEAKAGAKKADGKRSDVKKAEAKRSEVKKSERKEEPKKPAKPDDGEFARSEAGRSDTPRDNIGLMEAVVTSESELVGATASQIRLFDRFGLTLLAVSRRGRRIANRLRGVRFQPGDVVVLQGDLATMPETLGALHCLPLAERDLRIGRTASFLPLGILLAAMALVATGFVPVAIAFFGAAVLLMLFRQISLKEAYDAVEWPILILLGALIPVSDALRTTGGTDLIAHWLSMAGGYLPSLGSLALIMAVAMAVTPFLNNAATVLVMAPIAASFATQVHENPDPYLMAVAIGAACDFLTPIGHQCNTLVMGPGGYHFGDYWRLGLPLTFLVLLIGVPLIAFVWPF